MLLVKNSACCTQVDAMALAALPAHLLTRLPRPTALDQYNTKALDEYHTKKLDQYALGYDVLEVKVQDDGLAINAQGITSRCTTHHLEMH